MQSELIHAHIRRLAKETGIKVFTFAEVCNGAAEASFCPRKSINCQCRKCWALCRMWQRVAGMHNPHLQQQSQIARFMERSTRRESLQCISFVSAALFVKHVRARFLTFTCPIHAQVLADVRGR